MAAKALLAFAISALLVVDAAIVSDGSDDDAPADLEQDVSPQRVSAILRPYVCALYGAEANLKPEQAEMLATCVNGTRLDMLLIASYDNDSQIVSCFHRASFFFSFSPCEMWAVQVSAKA